MRSPSPTASCARTAPRCWSSPPTSCRAESIRPSGAAASCSPTRPVRSSWRLPTRPGSGVLGAKLAADGSGYGLIQIAAGGSRRPFAADMPIEDTQMTIADGQAVFTRAVEMMVASSREALAKAQLSRRGHRLSHPASGERAHHRRRRPAAWRACPRRSSRRIAKFGNSSAATIPLSLSLAAGEGRMARGQRLLMCAAGAGLTGGAVVYAL